MDWNDVRPEITESLRRSIQTVRTEASLKEVLSEVFPRDCSDLPISGGWGYSQEDAVIFAPRESSRVPYDYAGLEYHIAQKIIYLELIVSRKDDDRFNGIDMKRNLQRLIQDDGRSYDCLDFIVSCWHDFHWNKLKKEWEENEWDKRYCRRFFNHL